MWGRGGVSSLLHIVNGKELILLKNRNGRECARGSVLRTLVMALGDVWCVSISMGLTEAQSSWLGSSPEHKYKACRPGLSKESASMSVAQSPAHHSALQLLVISTFLLQSKLVPTPECGVAERPRSIPCAPSNLLKVLKTEEPGCLLSWESHN